MQNSRSNLGPRGWAILTLVAGAGLASPFLRPPQVELPAEISESSLGVAHAPGRLAAVRLAVDGLSSQALPGTSSAGDVGSGAARAWPGGPQIPEWAEPPSPIDQLISQGAAPPWQQPAVSDSPRLAPLQPWGGPTALSPIQPQSQVSLPESHRTTFPPSEHQLRPVVSPSTAGSAGSLPVVRSQLAAAHQSPQANSAPPVAASQAVAPRAFVFQPGYADRQQPR